MIAHAQQGRGQCGIVPRRNQQADIGCHHVEQRSPVRRDDGSIVRERFEGDKGHAFGRISRRENKRVRVHEQRALGWTRHGARMAKNIRVLATEPVKTIGGVAAIKWAGGRKDKSGIRVAGTAPSIRFEDSGRGGEKAFLFAAQ